MPLPRFQPVQPVQRRKPFDHPDWLFELKYDGFRALAYLEHGTCKFLSRTGYQLSGFQHVERWLAEHLNVKDAILDGELCCLDESGRPQFNQLELRSHEAHYIAFDLLWLNGQDLRTLPLVDRKQRLARIVPARPSWLIYLGHVEGSGMELFKQVCKHDLEGIVAKLKNGKYDGRTVWYKVKNPDYSQREGRHERFISRLGYNDIKHVKELANEAVCQGPFYDSEGIVPRIWRFREATRLTLGHLRSGEAPAKLQIRIRGKIG